MCIRDRGQDSEQYLRRCGQEELLNPPAPRLLQGGSLWISPCSLWKDSPPRHPRAEELPTGPAAYCVLKQLWMQYPEHPRRQPSELPASYNPPLFPPVSYTHLRAHETVLDLVCRLLLEK